MNLLRTLTILGLASCCAIAQLSGPYSINPTLPASSANFTSLNAAVTALGAQGVGGPVVFDVFDDGGPYLESVLFFAPSPSPLSANLGLGDNLAVMLLGQWSGVSATNTVTFRAAPGEFPVLDANGHGVVIYWNGADYTTLEGLDLRGATQDAICMYTPGTQNALANTITRCVIHHCGRVGILVYGNSGPVNDTLITNNVFHDLVTNPNGGSFSGFIRDGYVAGRRDNNTRILNNTFICNTMAQSDGWIVGNYPGSSQYTAFTKVQGNIFVKTALSGYVFRHQTALTVSACTTNAPTIPAIQDQNCFWDTSGGSFALVGSVPSPTQCPAYAPAIYATLAAWQAGVSRDLGSISANPLLSGPGTIAHHLSPGSPCIGLAGVIPEVIVDIDGQQRDASPDAGADELTSAPVATVTVVGSGCPGTGGLAPALSTAQVPSLGNLGFSVSVTSAAANAPSYLFLAIGLETPPFGIGGACFIHLDVQSLAGFLAAGIGPFGPVYTNGAGTAAFALPVPNDPALAGQQVDLQAGVIDAGSVIGLTVTNALDCVIN